MSGALLITGLSVFLVIANSAPISKEKGRPWFLILVSAWAAANIWSGV